ncbi:tryptophan halogenase family protein [Cellvibrio sp. ARAG 10.3]|uniref:tryptophan halogenase family protein n=1 Tax=Cellvibrio sp. ARAG 10.3 TaxID=3451358 RepID=UPI003F44D20C
MGGGTAGWMTAMLFQRAFQDCSITLVESDKTGIIGVGEGSTPALKAFMDAIGINEREWIPACQATFKSGISFKNWSTKNGFREYFHPFFSHFDRDHIKALIYNSGLRRAGKHVHAHPNIFSYSYYLASDSLCPITPYSFPFEVQYGYHFDAGMLGNFLKEKSIKRGVVWKSAHVENVVLNMDGDISHLLFEDGAILDGDFFIDCSGFASLITGKALNTPFISYNDTLFNDRAITLVTPVEEVISTKTLSTALNNGWAWRIPLQNRVGNGYVYSSAFCSDSEAEAELRTHLKMEDEEGEVRHLKMRVGRVKAMWNRNSLAVGLSQGFLEPLEATALALVQLTIVRFVKLYKAGGYTNQYAEHFNKEIGEAFDNVKEYIHAHYLTSDREDTPYWKACRRSEISPRLKLLMEAWLNGENISVVLQNTGLNRHYKVNSWLYLLSGMGIFPPDDQLRKASSHELTKVPLDTIVDFFERCALNHMSQKEALEIMRAGASPFDVESRNKAGMEHSLARLLGLNFAVSS